MLAPQLLLQQDRLIWYSTLTAEQKVQGSIPGADLWCTR